jgi:hypothetical protein
MKFCLDKKTIELREMEAPVMKMVGDGRMLKSLQKQRRGVLLQLLSISLATEQGDCLHEPRFFFFFDIS